MILLSCRSKVWPYPMFLPLVLGLRIRHDPPPTWKVIWSFFKNMVRIMTLRSMSPVKLIYPSARYIGRERHALTQWLFSLLRSWGSRWQSRWGRLLEAVQLVAILAKTAFHRWCCLEYGNVCLNATHGRYLHGRIFTNPARSLRSMSVTIKVRRSPWDFFLIVLWKAYPAPWFSLLA